MRVELSTTSRRSPIHYNSDDEGNVKQRRHRVDSEVLSLFSVLFQEKKYSWRGPLLRLYVESVDSLFERFRGMGIVSLGLLVCH